MLVGKIIVGELHHCNTSLEFTFLARWPINADVEFDAGVLDSMIYLQVWVVLASQGRDETLSNMVELLVDKVQDEDLVLVNLLSKVISSVCSKVNA